MAQLVSIQQAARNALKAWLTTELATVAGGAGVTVEPRWFEPDRQLPARAISIIDAGPRRIEWLQPSVVAQANNGATRVDATWVLGLVQQPVQLDVWTQSDVELDDIMARLDRSLNAGERGTGASNVDPFRPGVVLNLADGWSPGRVDFLFETPVVEPSPGSVVEGEWRAMYRGRCDALLVQVETTARLATIKVKQRLRATDPVDTTQLYDIATITAAGETYSTGS